MPQEMRMRDADSAIVRVAHYMSIVAAMLRTACAYCRVRVAYCMRTVGGLLHPMQLRSPRFAFHRKTTIHPGRICETEPRGLLSKSHGMHRFVSFPCTTQCFCPRPTDTPSNIRVNH